jgi:hypothetical protein
MEGLRGTREAENQVKKHELLERMQATRAEVLAAIKSFSETDMQRLKNSDGWTFKDILAHLARWEGELVTLLWQLEQGQKLESVLAQEPLQVDELNKTWYEADRSRDLSRVLYDLRAVRLQTIRRLAAFSDDDLERSNVHQALGELPLWHRVAANTFEHDEEHLPDLRSGGAA